MDDSVLKITDFNEVTTTYTQKKRKKKFYLYLGFFFFRFRHGFKKFFSCCPFVTVNQEPAFTRAATSRYGCTASPDMPVKSFRQKDKKK